MNEPLPVWRGDMRETFARALNVREPPTSPDLVWLVTGALWYAEWRFPVFPLQPGTKLPYHGTRGVNDASTDPDLIRTWWSYRPDSNVGLATGHGVDVIDFDGPSAHQAWLDDHPACTRWDECGIYVLGIVHTPRPGGLHLYIDSTGTGNRTGLVPGVDYRGLGGYVVAPPSHTSVGRYLWIDRLEPAMVTR